MFFEGVRNRWQNQIQRLRLLRKTSCFIYWFITGSSGTFSDNRLQQLSHSVRRISHIAEVSQGCISIGVFTWYIFIFFFSLSGKSLKLCASGPSGCVPAQGTRRSIRWCRGTTRLGQAAAATRRKVTAAGCGEKKRGLTARTATYAMWATAEQCMRHADLRLF